MPVVTLPNGTTKDFDGPVTIADVAASIGPGLAKAAVAGVVNGSRSEGAVAVASSIDTPQTLTKQEAEQNKPAALKILFPILKLFFSEKR